MRIAIPHDAGAEGLGVEPPSSPTGPAAVALGPRAQRRGSVALGAVADSPTWHGSLGGVGAQHGPRTEHAGMVSGWRPTNARVGPACGLS